MMKTIVTFLKLLAVLLVISSISLFYRAYKIGQEKSATPSPVYNQEKQLGAMGSVRTKTVRIHAGSFFGNGTNGANSDASNTLPIITFNLPESNVVIRNATLEHKMIWECYANNTGDYYGYNVAMDFCQGSCTPVAWTGTSTYYSNLSSTTTQPYSEDETESVGIVRYFNVNEPDLNSYTGGGTNISFQVGYRINRGTAVNSICVANDTLILTYDYDSNSSSYMNTVLYPLDTVATTTTACVHGSTCPSWTYNAVIPELTATSSSIYKVQFMDNITANATDVNITAKIGANATSTAVIGEKAQGTDYVMKWRDIINYASFAPNTSQTVSIRAMGGTGSAVNNIGGEIEVNYIGSNSGTRTRTVSFPIGSFVGSSTASTTLATSIFFPENGTTTGVVSVQSAWLRLHVGVNDGTSTRANELAVESKVGDLASSSASYSVNKMPFANYNNNSIDIIRSLPSSDYSALSSSSVSTSTNFALTFKMASTSVMHVDAELMVTYTYQYENYGYLNYVESFAYDMPYLSLDNATVQSAGGSSTIIKETSGISNMWSGIKYSIQISDSDGNFPGTPGVARTEDLYYISVQPSATSCSPQLWFRYTGSPVDWEGIIATSTISTSSQAYNITFCKTNVADTNTLKFVFSTLYALTYAWVDPSPTPPSAPSAVYTTEPVIQIE